MYRNSLSWYGRIGHNAKRRKAYYQKDGKYEVKCAAKQRMDELHERELNER